MGNETVFSTVDKSYIKKCPFTTFASGQQPKNAVSYVVQICKDYSSIYRHNINNCFQLECKSPYRKCYVCIKQGKEGPDTCIDPKTGSETGLCAFHTENGEEARRQRKTEPQEETTVVSIFKKEDDEDIYLDGNDDALDKTSQKKEVNIVMAKIVELVPYQIKILEELKKGVDQNGHFNKETTQKVAENLGQNSHSIIACVSQLLKLGMVSRLSKGRYCILNKEYAPKTKERKKTKSPAPHKKQLAEKVHQLLNKKTVVEEVVRVEKQIEDLQSKKGELESFLALYDKLTKIMWPPFKRRGAGS